MSTQEEALKAVRAALERERRINLHQHPIEMHFENDDLVLAGEVGNIAAKKLALELAAATPGVGGIVDRLRVVPAERMGDGAILDHVRDALLQEPELSICDIRVWEKGREETIRETTKELVCVIQISVADGMVTLDGQVDSWGRKRMAGALAWWVPGTRDVINALEILPPEEDSDDEVTNAIQFLLEKDPFVNESQIRVTTRNYVVTLEGLVANEKEKEMAEADAWFIFGVDKVINRLQVQA